LFLKEVDVRKLPEPVVETVTIGNTAKVKVASIAGIIPVYAYVQTSGGMTVTGRHYWTDLVFTSTDVTKDLLGAHVKISIENSKATYEGLLTEHCADEYTAKIDIAYLK
jgi:hypothetical protein